MLPRKPRSNYLQPLPTDGHRKVAVRVSETAGRVIVSATAECIPGTVLRRPGDFHDHGGMRSSKDPDTMAEQQDDPGVRLDLWLWAARFFRTRSLAKQAIETGKVDVDGQRAKAARNVRVGDAMKVVRGEETFVIEVAATSAKRGAAVVARTLYRESDESRLARETRRAELAAARAGYQAPQTKPDKRARKLIRALGDIDAS